MCGCQMFTEAVHYHCPLCKEPILIQYAPDNEIARLRYTDDGSNYAHKACMAKKSKDGTGTKKAAFKLGDIKQTNQVCILAKKEVETLVLLLARLGVFDPSGEIDLDKLSDQGVELTDETNVLVKLMNATEAV